MTQIEDTNTYKTFLDTVFKLKESNNDIHDYKKLVDFHITETEIKAFYIVRKRTIKEFQNLQLERINFKYNENYLLFEAIFYEKLDFVKYLVEVKGADLNIFDKHGRDPIQFALLNNQSSDIAKYLLSRNTIKIDEWLLDIVNETINNVNINTLNYKDSSGSTLLHYLCARNNVNLFEKLGVPAIVALKHIEVTDNEGFTCVDRAAANGHLDMLNAIHKIIKFEIDYSNEITKSLLSKALTYSPNEKVLSWLTNKMFSKVSFLSEQDRISILFQVNGRKTNAINSKLRCLIEINDFDQNSMDSEGNNILMNLARISHGLIDLTIFNSIIPEEIEPVEYLKRKNKLNQTVAHIAAMHGNSELLNIYQTYDLQIDTFEPDAFGYTCLMYGVQNGCKDIINFLPKKIEKGFDVYGLVYLALIHNRIEIFEQLLMKYKEIKLPKLQVEVKSVDNEKQYPIYLIKIAEKSEINLKDNNQFVLNLFKNCTLECFVEFKIPFEEYTDTFDAKAIHIFSLFGRNDAILWLYNNKYDIHATDKYGNTALYYASCNNKKETMLVLTLLGLNYTNTNTKETDTIDSILHDFDKETLNLIKNISNGDAFSDEYIFFEIEQDDSGLKFAVLSEVKDIKRNGNYTITMLEEKHDSVKTIKVGLNKGKQKYVVVINKNSNYIILYDIKKSDLVVHKRKKNAYVDDNMFEEISIYDSKNSSEISLKKCFLHRNDSTEAWIVSFNSSKSELIVNKFDINAVVTPDLHSTDLSDFDIQEFFDCILTKGYFVLWNDKHSTIYYIDVNCKETFSKKFKNVSIEDVRAITDSNDVLIVNNKTNSIDYIEAKKTDDNKISFEIHKELFKHNGVFFMNIQNRYLFIIIEKCIIIHELEKVKKKQPLNKPYATIQTTSDIEDELFVTKNGKYLLFNTMITSTKRPTYKLNLYDLEKLTIIPIHCDCDIKNYNFSGYVELSGTIYMTRKEKIYFMNVE